MANPWEFNWVTDDDQAPAQPPVAKPPVAQPPTTPPWMLNFDFNRAEQSAASQDYRRIKPMVTIGQSNVANNLINEEYQAPELLHEDANTQDFVRPEGELFHARSFVPGVTPSQGEPLSLEEPGWFRATAGQVGKGVGDMAQTVATLADGTPANMRRLPLDKTDSPINVANDDWSLTAKKITSRAMRMAPMALQVMAGAMMGAGPTVALSTAVEGGAGGAMVGTWLQSAGPKFQAALQKYPDDPERAWQEAGNAALIDTGFAGAAGLLMGANPFSNEIANGVFQMFGLQPTVGIWNMIADEEYTGDRSDQSFLDRYIENVGPSVLQTGAERLGSVLGLGDHQPGSSLPGGPDGPGGAGGDEHFINGIQEARPSDYAHLNGSDPRSQQAGAAPTDIKPRAKPADQGVNLGEEHRVHGKNEDHNVRYDHLDDGRVRRTVTYDDGQTDRHVLEEDDKTGDADWVNQDMRSAGKTRPSTPLKLSPEVAQSWAESDYQGMHNDGQQPRRTVRYQKADEEPVDTRLRDINEQLPLKSREVFDNLKLSKAPMSDWHGIMLNKGVKPEEMKDLGLTAEFKKDPKKAWSRAEIDALIKRNTPVFKEHLYSAARHDEKRYVLIQDRSNPYVNDPDGAFRWVDQRTGEKTGEFASKDEALTSPPPDAIEMVDTDGVTHDGPLSEVGYSKWDKYTGQELVSPGVGNYEERVVQQVKERPSLKSLTEYVGERLGSDSRELWSRMSLEEKEAFNKDYERDVVEPWKDASQQWNDSRWNIGDTHGDHFGHKNSVFHNRYGTLEFDDGVTSLQDDEAQSDVIQRGRTEGFREESPTAIRNRADALQDEFKSKHAAWNAILSDYSGLVEKLVGIGPTEPSMRNRVAPRAKHLLELAERDPADAARMGYSPYEQEIARRDYDEVIRLQAEWQALDQKRMDVESEVNRTPIVPHLDSWGKTSMKRMVQVALSKGLRHISWTTGEQQAKRNSLENKLEHITFRPADRSNPNGDKVVWTAVKIGGDTPINHRESTFKDLADHISAEHAKKIFDKAKTWDPEGNQDTWLRYEGEDLKTGGEFHKKLYDQKKVEWARELGKPFGFKPELKSASHDPTNMPQTLNPFSVGDAGWGKFKDAVKGVLTDQNGLAYELLDPMMRVYEEMNLMEKQGGGSSADLVDFMHYYLSTNDRNKVLKVLASKVPEAIGNGRKVAIDHPIGSEGRRQMLAAITKLNQKVKAGDYTRLLRSWFNRNDFRNPHLLDDLEFTVQTPNRDMPGYFDSLRERLDSQDDADLLMRAIQHEQRSMFGDSAKPLFEMAHTARTPRQMWRMEITPKMGKQFRYQIAKEEEEARPGTLAVVHNISADALIHADRMGGLAAPSIGIVKAEHGLPGFGEISLLGHADLIDPQRSQHNKVYDSDIYSPRYPYTGAKIDMAKLPLMKEILADEIRRSGHEREPVPSDFGKDASPHYFGSIHPAIMKFAREHGIIGADENIMSPHGQGKGKKPTPEAKAAAVARTKEVAAQVSKHPRLKAWIDRTFRPMFKDEYVRARPGWKFQGDLPHTLENVVRMMTDTDDIRATGDFSSVGRVRGAQAQQFKTLDEIRAASDRLAPKSAFTKDFDEVNKIYSDLIGSLSEKVPEEVAARKGEVFGGAYRGPSNAWAAEALTEAARTGDVAGSIRAKIPRATDEEIASATEMLSRLKVMPRPYFEAKVTRPVGIDEFSAAVVPSNLREDASAVLDKNGVAERIIYQHSDDPIQNEFNRNQAIAAYKKLRLQRTEGGGELTGNMDDLRKVSLTKEQAAKHAPLMKSIIEEIQRIAPGAKVAFVERLLTRGEDGRMSPLGGVNFGEMVVVALRNKDAMGSGRHEGGHVVVDFFKGLGIFKPHEWEALTRYAKEKLFKKHEKFLSYYENKGPDVMMSEAIVQELGVGRPTKFKGYPPIIRKMLYRMDGVLKAIRVGVHRVLGKKVKGEDVMAMLDAGHIGARAKRKLRKLGATATTDYGLATDASGKVHYQVTPESKLDNVFDSALDIALGSTKLTRGHGAQWRAELIKQGVKPEELRDTGLEHLFTEFKDKPLTKDHVVNRREDNRTELHVIIKDDGTKPLSRALTVQEEKKKPVPAAPPADPDFPGDPFETVDMDESRFDDMDDVREYIRDNFASDEISDRLDHYDGGDDNPRTRYEHREYDNPAYRVVERDGRGETVDYHDIHESESDADWDVSNNRYMKPTVYFHGKPREVGGLLTRLMGRPSKWEVDIHQHATNRKNKPVDIGGEEIDTDELSNDDQPEYQLSDPDNHDHDADFHNHEVKETIVGDSEEEAIKKALQHIRDESRVFYTEEEPQEGYRVYDLKNDDWEESGDHFETERSGERAAERLNNDWYEEWSEQAHDEIEEELNDDHDWWVSQAVDALVDEAGSELDHNDLADRVRHHWYGNNRRRNNNNNRPRIPTSVDSTRYGSYNLKGGGTYKREYLVTIPTLPDKLLLAPPGENAVQIYQPDPSSPAERIRDQVSRGLPSHFGSDDHRNIAQHFRAQDFEAEDGGKAIVFEEDQSDPHQAARQAAKILADVLGPREQGYTGYGAEERELKYLGTTELNKHKEGVRDNARALSHALKEAISLNLDLKRLYDTDPRKGEDWTFGDYAKWDDVEYTSEYLGVDSDKIPSHMQGAVRYLKEQLKKLPSRGIVPNASNALVEAELLSRARLRIGRGINKSDEAWSKLMSADPQPDSLPHKDSWPMVALKYILHEAIVNGYDWVGMPTGAQQVERYPGALRTAVKKLVWKERRDGKFDLEIDMQKDRQHRQRHVLEGLTELDIKNNLGKAGAEQIVQQRHGHNSAFDPTDKYIASGTIEDGGLAINNQGMMNFYDKTVQKDSKAFLAKMGLKWGTLRVVKNPAEAWAVTGQHRWEQSGLRENVESFSTREAAEAYAEAKRLQNESDIAEGSTPSWSELKVERNAKAFHEIHGIKVTPEARQGYQTEITDKAGVVVKPANKMLRYQIADGETDYADRVARATTDTPAFKRFFEGSVATTPDGRPLKLFRGQRRNAREDGFTLTSGRATPSFTPDPDVASVYSRQLPGKQYGAGSNVLPTYLSIKKPLDLRAVGEHPSLGDVVELLNYDWNEPTGLHDGKVGYIDIAEALRDMDTTAYRTGAEHDIRAGDSDGMQVRSFDELADLIEQLGEDGKYEELENALHDSSLDAYSFADSPMFVDMLKQLGYDGVIHKDVFEGGADHYEPGRDKLEEGSTGVPVHDTYRPFEQGQVKSTHNSGTWNRGDKRILYQAAGDPESHNFKKWFGISRVVDGKGKPLALYRGEHGEPNGEDIQTRLPSITLVEDPDMASMYALEPNIRRDVAEAPRVGTYYARIEHPIFEDKDDPFTELAPLVRKLGKRELLKVIEDGDVLESAIMDTDNWHEKFDDYDSVRELLDENPAAINDLYIQANILLDDPGFVKLAASKGYDGAIHLAWSAAKDAVEYRVFDQGQIKGVNNGGEWSTTDKRVMYQKELPYVPVKDKYKKGELAPADPKVNTPEFKSWWKKSHAIDSVGHPITVFHGSNHDITEFKPGNNGNFFGNRFYFTNSRDDASFNYTGYDAPDFDQRAWDHAASEAPTLTTKELEQKVKEWKQATTAHEGAIYSFYLSIQKPLYLGGPNETSIPKSTMHAMLDHLPSVLKGVDGDLYKNKVVRQKFTEWLSKIMNTVPHGTTIGAGYFVWQLMDDPKLLHAVMTELPKFRADNPIPEVMRSLFEKMGYDGVIDTEVKDRWPAQFDGGSAERPRIDDDVVHYIAFHPNQIKSVNNTGSFSERMNHILYQMGDKFDTKYEDAPQGGRFLDTLRDGFANGKVDAGEQATISDQQGDLERVYKKDWLEQRRGAPHLKQFAIMLHGKPIGRINGTVSGESMEVSWLGMLGGDDGLSDSSIQHLGAILRQALPRGVKKLTGLRKRAEQKSEQPPIRPRLPAPKPIPRITTTREREDPLLDYYRDLGVDLGD
jgi:hypothetical protein